MEDFHFNHLKKCSWSKKYWTLWKAYEPLVSKQMRRLHFSLITHVGGLLLIKVRAFDYICREIIIHYITCLMPLNVED